VPQVAPTDDTSEQMSARVAPIEASYELQHPSLSMNVARQTVDPDMKSISMMGTGQINSLDTKLPPKITYHVDGEPQFMAQKTATQLLQNFKKDEESVSSLLGCVATPCQEVMGSSGYFAGINVTGCKACAGFHSRRVPHTCTDAGGVKKSIVKPCELSEELRICNDGHHFHYQGETYVYTRAFSNGAISLFTCCGATCPCCPPKGSMASTSEYASLDSDKIIHFSDNVDVEVGDGSYLISKGISTKIDGVEVGRLRMRPDKLYTWCSQVLRLCLFCPCHIFIWCKMCCRPPPPEEASYAINTNGSKMEYEGAPQWKQIRRSYGSFCCGLIKNIDGEYMPCYCKFFTGIFKAIKACILGALLLVFKVVSKCCKCVGCKCCPRFSSYTDDGPQCRHRRNGFWVSKIPGNDGSSAVGYVMQQLSFDDELDEEVHPTSGKVPIRIMSCRNAGNKPTDYLCAAAVLKHGHMDQASIQNNQLAQYGLLHEARSYMMPDAYDQLYGYGWIKAYTMESDFEKSDLTHKSTCEECIRRLEAGKHLTCPIAENQQMFERQLEKIRKQVEKNQIVKEAITPPEEEALGRKFRNPLAKLFGKKR